MVFEEGEMVLCTVDRIAGTVVFVKIEGEQREGSIIYSKKENCMQGSKRYRRNNKSFSKKSNPERKKRSDGPA